MGAPRAHQVRTVAVFTNHLLPYSETFVLAQANALRRHAPLFVGCRAVGGLTMPHPKVVINAGRPSERLQELCFKGFGLLPLAFRELADRDIALIHAHHWLNGALALDLAKSLRAPLVVTFHGNGGLLPEKDGGWLGFRYRRNRTKLMAQCDTIICASHFIRQQLLAAGFPIEKLQVHYIGVDTKLFAPADAARRNAVLCIARMVAVKGHDRLIAAMERVQRHIPDAELWLVGDGPLQAHLERRAHRLPVRFLGVKSQPQVLSLMRDARVVCLPSIELPNGQAEGLGLTLLEAQATGVPVVAFAHAGPREVVLNGETGITVPMGDIDALAEAIVLLLRDEVRWHRMSRTAVEFVRREFNLETQTAKLESLYEAVVAAHTGGESR